MADVTQKEITAVRHRELQVRIATGHWLMAWNPTVARPRRQQVYDRYSRAGRSRRVVGGQADTDRAAASGDRGGDEFALMGNSISWEVN